MPTNHIIDPASIALPPTEPIDITPFMITLLTSAMATGDRVAQVVP